MKSISNLLGTHQADPIIQTIADNFSKAFGRNVNVAPSVNNGYRNEGGRIFLRDIDPDEK